MRRRLDEAVAWEHEVSGGTYGAPRIRHALMRAGVDVGVRAVAASMHRLSLTGLNTRPRPSRRGGRPLVAHEDHCARQSDYGGLDRVWITDFSLTCAAPKAGSTCAPCAMRTHAVSWDTPWASSTTRALVITALDMAATTRGGFPAGVLSYADRGTQFTSQKLAAYMRAVKGTVSMGQAAVCWDNAMAESLWAPSQPITTTGVPSPPATRSTPGSPPGSKRSVKSWPRCSTGQRACRWMRTGSSARTTARTERPSSILRYVSGSI